MLCFISDTCLKKSLKVHNGNVKLEIKFCVYLNNSRNLVVGDKLLKMFLLSVEKVELFLLLQLPVFLLFNQ